MNDCIVTVDKYNHSIHCTLYNLHSNI